jgi:uncharacterized protein involved in type VI secretion and phage assembly
MSYLANTLIYQGIEALGRYYSFYRGIVVDNIDPEHMNRLQVAIPEVQGGISIWAYPFAQHGGLDTGFKYLAPELGDTVWVMFEFGNPSKPIWTYHSWGSEQIPPELDSPTRMGFITPNGNKILLEETNGELIIHTEGNIQIKANNDKGITLNDGKNEGMVKINELTQKLNKLVSEMETLRNQFNLHTHSGVTSGTSVSGPTPQQVTSPFSTFNKTDYEDKNCTH